MESIMGISGAGAAQLEAVTSLAAEVIGDTTSAQIVTKTLDKLNTHMTLTGPQIDQDYQFRKDVLMGLGIGTKLDAIV